MIDVMIDTQALIWFANGSDKLSALAREQIDDLSIVRFASVASLWEMAIKISLGKLKLKSGGLREFYNLLRLNQIELISVSAEDALRVCSLPLLEHKDPFDRLIAAQCLRRDLTLVSIDDQFDQ